MVMFDTDNPQTMVHKSLRTVPESVYDQWNISMVIFYIDNPQTMVHKSLRTVPGSVYDQWNISMVIFDTDIPQTMVHKTLRRKLKIEKHKPHKTGALLRCSERVNSSFSTRDTRRTTLVKIG
jgi:hypothetical protein